MTFDDKHKVANWYLVLLMLLRGIYIMVIILLIYIALYFKLL